MIPVWFSWYQQVFYINLCNHWTNHWYQWFNGKKTIDTNGSTVKNHWKTIVSNGKTIGKPLIPMVEMWKTIINDGSLVKKTLKNHYYNGALTKTIDIPLCPKIYHRRGLARFLKTTFFRFFPFKISAICIFLPNFFFASGKFSRPSWIGYICLHIQLFATKIAQWQIHPG